MPHYKDWYGTRFQDPADGGESGGTFEPEIDLTQAATKIDWRKTQSNTFPGFDEQNLNTAYWDNNNLPRPEAFAIIVQPKYTNPAVTYFQIWDGDWVQPTGEISGPAPTTMSFREILDNAKTNQSTAFSSIDSVYFQVDSVPIPEPSSGMLFGLAMVWSLVVLFTRRFWRLCTTAVR